MKIKYWPSLAVLCICTNPLQVLASGEAVTPNQAAVRTLPLRDLRKDMDKAERRFLALYNEVNPNVDQRLTCTDSAPTGSRLAKRSCSTGAQVRAKEEQARSFLGAIDTINGNQAQQEITQGQASVKAQAGAALTDDESAALSGRQAPDTDVDARSAEASGKVSEQMREFEENLQRLLESNPELQQRYDEFIAARQRFMDAGGRR